jgi:hypothetical protein
VSRFVATGVPIRATGRDPRADDPRWQRARERATQKAIEHFDCRDASETQILSFIHRETLRYLGEPVTQLWHGWGRTRRGLTKPEMPAELRTTTTRGGRR